MLGRCLEVPGRRLERYLEVLGRCPDVPGCARMCPKVPGDARGCLCLARCLEGARKVPGGARRCLRKKIHASHEFKISQALKTKCC